MSSRQWETGSQLDSADLLFFVDEKELSMKQIFDGSEVHGIDAKAKDVKAVLVAQRQDRIELLIKKLSYWNDSLDK